MPVELDKMAWLIEWTKDGVQHRDVHLHNAVGDYRALDPNAKATLLTSPLESEPSAWISFNVLTKTEHIARKQLVSMQAGVYQHTALYTKTEPKAGE